MRRLPDAVIIVDAKLENTAVKEASRLGIPIIAMVDSNTDPTKIDYPIPANDDSIRTIQLIMTKISDTILESSGAEKKSVETSEVKKDQTVSVEPKIDNVEIKDSIDAPLKKDAEKVEEKK